jgi:hypothetical protein
VSVILPRSRKVRSTFVFREIGQPLSIADAPEMLALTDGDDSSV